MEEIKGNQIWEEGCDEHINQKENNQFRSHCIVVWRLNRIKSAIFRCSNHSAQDCIEKSDKLWVYKGKDYTLWIDSFLFFDEFFRDC